MNVSEVMLTGLHMVSPTSTVKDAVIKMTELKRGAIVVGKPNKIQGILSERDILRKLISQDLSPEKTPVKDIMTSKVITIDYNSDINNALKLMEAMKIRHLPVVDQMSNYIGLISIRDVMNSISKSIDEENSKLSKYILEHNWASF